MQVGSGMMGKVEYAVMEELFGYLTLPNSFAHITPVKEYSYAD